MNDALAALLSGQNDGMMLMAPEQGDRVTACLRALASHPNAKDIFASTDINMHDEYWPAADSWQASLKPYQVKQGILQIPVKGVLLHNFPYAVGSWATGYYYVQKALERGLADPEVRGIALVCDSPGGHVAGCFELCDRIYNARKVKPIAAFAHEHAYSAGYAIFSSATKGTVSRTGGVGSIGVVTQHIDWSKALDQMGVKITYIFAGKHKVDGNPNEPLSADAKARIQTRIDETYGVFVAAVARNRGLDEKKIRATEALTYTATEAVDQKLADAIGPLDEAMAEFQSCLLGTDGEDQMTTDTKPAGVSQADHDSAVAAASASGATAAKQRISAIVGCDEAKDRPALAQTLAMDTDLPLDQAKAVLAKAPKEQAAAAADPKDTTTNAANPDFKAAMDGSQPGPGAGDGKGGELTAEQKQDARAAQILANTFGAEPASQAKH